VVNFMSAASSPFAGGTSEPHGKEEIVQVPKGQFGAVVVYIKYARR
jgi:hypothetical protein